MINIMVDLETLGTTPGCRIVSLGAVEFGSNGLGAQFYAEAKITYQGTLVTEAQTVKWWEDQPENVRNRLFDGQEGKPFLKTVLADFEAWLEQIAGRDDKGNLRVNVWGNGSDFDNAILAVAYKDVADKNLPWPFWNNRCYRTLKNLVPNVKLVRQGTLHNALDDAKSQAEHAVRLIESINGWA